MGENDKLPEEDTKRGYMFMNGGAGLCFFLSTNNKQQQSEHHDNAHFIGPDHSRTGRAGVLSTDISLGGGGEPVC